jgi:hypothetical protein
MVSHLFYSQLALVALIWLFVMLHLGWPRPSATPVLRKNSLLTTSASPAYPAMSLMVRCRIYGSIVDTTGHPIPCHKIPKILGTSLTM